MDIGLPPWEYEKFDGYLLMKFFSCEDYLEDFLNGKINPLCGMTDVSVCTRMLLNLKDI